MPALIKAPRVQSAVRLMSVPARRRTARSTQRLGRRRVDDHPAGPLAEHDLERLVQDLARTAAGCGIGITIASERASIASRTIRWPASPGRTFATVPAHPLAAARPLARRLDHRLRGRLGLGQRRVDVEVLRHGDGHDHPHVAAACATASLSAVAIASSE